MVVSTICIVSELPQSLQSKHRDQLAVGSEVNLEVYDVTGRKIMTLLDEHQPAGSHQIEYDASQLASGIYVYRLKAGRLVASRKMVVLK